MIQIKSYSIPANITLTSQVLENYINSFWKEIFDNIKDSHLMLMCKVQFTDESMGYKTLGHLVKTNYEDKELFIEYLSLRLGILSESYTVHPISQITFSYVIKSGKNTESNRALLQPEINYSKITHNFNNMVLPISMNPSDYGDILSDSYHQIDGNSIHRYIVENGTRSYIIDVSNNGLTNNVRIQGAINLSWVDTKISEDVIMREIKKSTIYFMDGVVVLRKQTLNAKPFTSLKIDSGKIGNFITMDIETIRKNGKLSPYLICAFNGKDYITSYGSDQNTLFNSFIDQLLSKIEKGKTTLVYAHNLSNFDGIFTLKHLIAYCQLIGKVEPLLFHGKIMSIKVTIGKGKNKKIIIFKDSYLLLPHSLRKLCKAFDVIATKGYFPFLLNNIYYSGVLPALEFWTTISPNIYKSLVSEYSAKKMWSFQLEAIKYCKLDCQSLHEVLTKFNELIYNEFKVDSHTVLTLPSLAMKIYKTHYMPENSIYQLLGKVEEAVRQSYSGGAVDVYIPHNRISSFLSKVKDTLFKTLYYYDVNSLYPFVMANHPMPIGKPVVFEGDIRKIDPQAFGYFYCKITSPENIQHPILQRSIKTSAGLRTVAGLGTWNGWIASTEMDNALKFGYQFDILNGYQFEKGDLFSGYVNKMYSLRLQYEKGTAMNLIAKLLMNSLYGKFGMKLETSVVEMYDTSTDLRLEIFKDTLEALGETLLDYIKIDKTYVIVRDTTLSMKYNEELDMYHGQDINVAIASAITAGARVHMSIFKNNPLFNLYYSDTDSAVTDQQLPQDMIGSELGQMKLEYIINKAIFLAPS